MLSAADTRYAKTETALHPALALGARIRSAESHSVIKTARGGCNADKNDKGRGGRGRTGALRSLVCAMMLPGGARLPRATSTLLPTTPHPPQKTAAAPHDSEPRGTVATVL